MQSESFQRTSASPSRGSHTPGSGAGGASSTLHRVSWVILPLSLLFCVVQALITIFAEHTHSATLTPTLIPTIGFGVLTILLLLVNPVLRLIRLRGFNRAELMSMFAAMLVTAGVSTFGLSSQLVPLIAAPWNADWNTPQSGWSEDVLPNLNHSLYITDAQKIAEFRQGFKPQYTTEAGETRVMPRPPADAPFSQKWDYYQAVFFQLPWNIWLGPLAYWMIFVVACYLMFYSLTYVVLDYWVNREKLIFPIVQLTESILPEEGQRQVPRIFRTPAFWLGFGISFVFITWNSLAAAHMTGGLARINLGFDPRNLINGNSVVGGLYNDLTFLIIFTAVGIAFLLPKAISYSTWLYYLLGQLMLLVGVWLGYHTLTLEFASDFRWVSNPVTSQGGGAMFAFSVLVLYRCIREYFARAKGRPIGKKIVIMLPLIGLVTSLMIITGWLVWNNLPLFWAIMIVLVLMLLTIGLMRIVAEGGIYWFQASTGVLHVYKIFGLSKFLSPTLIGPMLPIGSVLFLDYKTFIAPNILHAGKARDDVSAGRFKFHLNIVLCLAVSVVVALGYSVFLAYLIGGNNMNNWFYTSGPKLLIQDSARMATMDLSFETVNAVWFIIGVLWLLLTMYLRRSIFWFPHPIGYIMLVNPLMKQLWFSFFLGWLFKTLVLRYGGKMTFDKVRLLFIGLIMGELIGIFIWQITGLGMGINFGAATLNRYTP